MAENWLKARRKNIGYSQGDLARIMQSMGYEVSPGSISHWETGRYAVPFDDHVFRSVLAKALKMSIPMMLRAAGFEMSTGFSSPAIHAAELIDELPESEREWAVGVLEKIVRGK
jgi:transcriptional regulator with XRE-family HTH domain